MKIDRIDRSGRGSKAARGLPPFLSLLWCTNTVLAETACVAFDRESEIKCLGLCEVGWGRGRSSEWEVRAVSSGISQSRPIPCFGAVLMELSPRAAFDFCAGQVFWCVLFVSYLGVPFLYLLVVWFSSAPLRLGLHAL